MNPIVHEGVRPGQVPLFANANVRHANDSRVTRNPSLSDSELDAARAIVAQIVQKHGSRTRAAQALKMSKSLVSEFLNGTKTIGMKAIAAIADESHKSIDEVLGRTGGVDLTRLMEAYRPQELGDLPGFYEMYPVALWKLPGFDEAAHYLEDAQDIHPLPPGLLKDARNVCLTKPPSRITPQFLRRICDALLQAREDGLLGSGEPEDDGPFAGVNSNPPETPPR